MGEMCRILVWGGFWCLLWSGTASGQFTSSPQTRPGLGAQTWFHGWYTRITSHNGEDVVGILTASLFDLDPQDCLDHTGGYVAIMRRNRVTGRLDVYESFPPSTRVVLGNALAGKQAEKVGYHWEADGIGFANEDEVHIQLHDGISFTACFHNRQAWDPKHPRRGPEGLAEYLALLRAHWSVYSVASETSFRLADSTGEFIGKGVAHQETNWGQAFPKAFVWAQGCSPDGQASFVLAGGKLPLGAGNLQGWLAGLRTPDVAWDFRPQVPGTVFSTQIVPAEGRFSMTARSLLKSVTFEICADPSTFTDLAVPTREGFAYETMQSYSAVAKVRAYRHGPLGVNPRLVDSIEFRNAALEFGAEFRSAGFARH